MDYNAEFSDRRTGYFLGATWRSPPANSMSGAASLFSATSAMQAQTSDPMADVFNTYLERAKEKGLYRALPEVVNEQDLLDFSHNDYLGLSQHPKILETAHAYGLHWGVGGQASRILSQNQALYEDLEAMIAQDKGMEAALVFPTGYQANATVLAALLDSKVLGARPLVFSDRLNHASIHHGCFLAGAKQFRYPNTDLEALESLLRKHKRSSHPKFILTESVFSMDGSCVNMGELTRLAKAYDAFLYVDEAHATGLYGKKGYGFTSDVDGVDVSMGTFSKALGVQGGYVTCSKTVKRYLINKCTGFIYSTGTSPLLIGAITAAWKMVPEIEQDRTRLSDNAKFLRKKLNAIGFDTGLSKTHIIPIILGKISRATALRDCLLERNMITSVIRPPTVPPHTARVRLCLNAQHTRQDLMRLLDCVEAWKKKHG